MLFYRRDDSCTKREEKCYLFEEMQCLSGRQTSISVKILLHVRSANEKKEAELIRELFSLLLAPLSGDRAIGLLCV